MNDEISNYFKEKRDLYEHLIEFIESRELSDEIYFNKLINLLNSQELEPSLRLILSIANNHHHNNLFYDKIGKIILNLEDQIKQTFSNYELYNMFISNKKILLFLINKKIIIIDESVKKSLLTMLEKNGIQYCHFFLPEIKKVSDEITLKMIQNQFSDENINKYEEKRKIGENDSYICELIRNDSIDEFVSYLNRTNTLLSTKIERSIFETNSYLNENDPNLIEYAAFFGSIQIFNYLRFNRVELNSNLWIYSIHSKNSELIHLLESIQVPPPNDSFESCLIESIKCHHNDLAKYFENTKTIENCKENVVESSFKYYNYEYLPDNMVQNYIFFNLVQNKYMKVVDIWLNSKKEDILSNIDLKDEI